MVSVRLVLHADGGCWPNPGLGSYGVVALVDGRTIQRISQRIGYATNNVAEYRGALAALQYALDHATEYTDVDLRLDSKLVVHQLNRRWRVKSEDLRPLAEIGWLRLAELKTRGLAVTVRWIPREENTIADEAAAYA